MDLAAIWAQVLAFLQGDVVNQIVTFITSLLGGLLPGS
jgi:hypothetical protein